MLVQLQRATEHPLSKLPSGSDFSPLVQAVSICSKGPFISYLQKLHDRIFFFRSLPWSTVSSAQVENARKVQSLRKVRRLLAAASVVASASPSTEGQQLLKTPAARAGGLPPPCLHVQSCAWLWPVPCKASEGLLGATTGIKLAVRALQVGIEPPGWYLTSRLVFNLLVGI